MRRVQCRGQRTAGSVGAEQVRARSFCGKWQETKASPRRNHQERAMAPLHPSKSPERGACWSSHDSRKLSGRKLFLGFVFLVLLMIYFSCYRGTSVHCRKFRFIYIGFIFTPNQQEKLLMFCYFCSQGFATYLLLSVHMLEH